MERTQIEFWDGIHFDKELDREKEKKNTQKSLRIWHGSVYSHRKNGV